MQDAKQGALEGQNPDADTPELTAPQQPEPAGKTSMSPRAACILFTLLLLAYCYCSCNSTHAVEIPPSSGCLYIIKSLLGCALISLTLPPCCAKLCSAVLCFACWTPSLNQLSFGASYNLVLSAPLPCSSH